MDLVPALAAATVFLLKKQRQSHKQPPSSSERDSGACAGDGPLHRQVRSAGGSGGPTPLLLSRLSRPRQCQEGCLLSGCRQLDP